MSQFDHFFPKFLTDFVIWNIGKEFVSCRVDISEKIIAVFYFEKVSNWHRKRQLTQVSQIFKFYAFFVKSSPDFVDWSVENVHQGKKSFSSSLS